jgi:hypothetical protein
MPNLALCGAEAPGNSARAEEARQMKITTDLYTGKPFRWNTTVLHRAPDGKLTTVPARSTSRSSTWLHPSRVPAALLAELNPDKTKP